VLKAHHDFRRLLGMRSAACTQELVGRGDSQFIEKHVIQLAIVVLAGMDDLEAQRLAVCTQCPHERRDLHEVGPSAADQVNTHFRP
jgi:hypothetical protein